jgi:Putative Zn-dependent protease, contains TPR repeats
LKELQQNIKIVPSRYYLSIAKIIYDKIDTKLAKSFLSQNIPNNLDLETAIKNLPKLEIFDYSKLLSNVFYECGYIIARSEGFFKSVPQFWFSLHLNENNEQSRLILSSFFSEVNQDDIALDILRNNKTKSPSWIISEFEKSYILEKKGNIELAISTIKKFTNKNDFKNKALLRISNIYRRNNEYKKSMEALEKIDLTKINSPEVFYYRSLNLVLLKDWQNAIKSFDILLKKYPNNPEISNFVGYTLVDRNVRLDEGIQLIKFAVSKEPQNGFFLDSLGWAFYKLNDFKKAIII